MSCPQCGKAVAKGAKFCPECGAPLQLSAQSPQVARAVVTPELDVAAYRRRLLTIFGFVMAMLVAAAALALFLVLPNLKEKGRSLTQAGLAQGPKGESILQAQAPPQPESELTVTNVQPPETKGNVTETTSPTPPPQPTPPQPSPHQQPPQPQTPKTPQPPPGPPQDVLDYLHALCAIEKERQKEDREMFSKTFSDVLSHYLKMIGGLMEPDAKDYDPAELRQQVQQRFKGHRTKFASLQQQLNQLRVPPSCLHLHNTYISALGNYPELIEKLEKAVFELDLSSAQSLLPVARQTIDEPFAEADKAMDDICDQFNIRKPCKIAHGGLGPSIPGF